MKLVLKSAQCTILVPEKCQTRAQVIYAKVGKEMCTTGFVQ